MSIGPNQVLGAEEVIRGASQVTHGTGHMVDSDGAEKLVSDSEMAVVDPEDQNLPPIDGGPAAWRFIFGAFMMEAFQWGFALNYGVFQNYYFKHQPFQGNKSLSIVGTVATGGFFLGAPVVIPFIKFFPGCRRPMVWIGWALSVLSLIAASFATTLGVLIATQGVIYTVGITILYWPVMSMMSEWFVKKRGLAFGIFTAATGLSGIIMPFALAALLDRMGMTFGDDEDVALTTFGIFAFLKGIGNIITGPIGAALVAQDVVTKAYGLESWPSQWSILQYGAAILRIRTTGRVFSLTTLNVSEWTQGVKSYTNVASSFTKKPLSQYTSIPTSWSWSYTGTSLRANVAYDTFLSTSPTGSQTHEIMIWLGVFGDIYPLSDNGYPPTPVATPTIGGIAFDLIAGHNGNVIVYSFVAKTAATSFSGDLVAFYKYLEGNFGLGSGLYLQTVQAGTEVFTGSGAKLTTSGYSIKVN
ncbi:hypothetical protein Q9189_007230 [Teloschistes chrysophthalmus]